jgi:hypothetical protein
MYTKFVKDATADPYIARCLFRSTCIADRHLAIKATVLKLWPVNMLKNCTRSGPTSTCFYEVFS